MSQSVGLSVGQKKLVFMSNQKKIIGQSITVYMDGGWTLSGVVKTSEDNRMVISNEGELYLIFKDKVCAMKLSANSEVTRPKPEKVRKKRSDFPENKLQYSEQSMSIPSSLLSKGVDDNDFSISFGGKSSKADDETGIRFEVDEDT